MINEIKEVVQLGGTVTTVILFLYYLNKKDEMNKKTYKEFNSMINNHLHTSNSIIEKNSQALSKVAVNLKVLSVIIKNEKKVKS